MPLTSLHTGFGYKDNVTLASFQPKGSAFAENGLEFILARTAEGNTEFQAFLEGTDIRYFSTIRDDNNHVTDKEQNAIVQTDLRQRIGADWKIGLVLEYIYQDQVLDSSDQPNITASIPATSHTFTAHAPLRYELPKGCWLEAEGFLSRANYNAPIGDYWEGGQRLTLGKVYGSQSEITASYQFEIRPYDTDTEVDTTGTDIPGTHLRFYLHRFDLAWKHNFDAARNWSLTTKFVYERNDSTGSEYFAYNRYQLLERLRIRHEPWELTTEARFGKTDYDVQSVDISTLDPRRHLDASCSIRAERALTKWLKIFAIYQFERSLSNLKSEEYIANTGSAGVILEF
jgi:hypothetical protein